MTNVSRWTANVRHFYHAFVCVITVLCGKLLAALLSPCSGVEKGLIAP
ncbi:DUF3265 domain-containing protein [Vibrio cholerae]|nr:DUF3265 domain-containing protein [Vibrio cholerae]